MYNSHINPFDDAECVNLLKELHTEALKAQVSYEISYNEGSNEWCCSISSPAPVECYVSKDYSNLSLAIDSTLKHLTKN